MNWLSMGIGIAVAAALGVFLWHYESLVTKAERADQLETALTSVATRADKAERRLAEIDAARAQAERDLTDWQGMKAAIMAALRKGGSNAVAATDPHCAPSDNDRQLRNDALDRLVGPGPAGSAPGVPESAGAPH